MPDPEGAVQSDADVATGDEKARRVQYVDLVLGAWRPREAAFQLASGMEIELGPMAGVEKEEGAITIGAPAIDVEAGGDPLVNQAWEDACRVVAALPGGAVVIVLAPRFDLPMRAENEWFFHFLRRLGQAVVIIGKDPPMQAVGKSPFERRRSVVSPEWEIRPDKVGAGRMRLLRLFPGLIPRAVAEHGGLIDDDVMLIPAGQRHFLVPTGFRDTDPRGAARDFDALEAIEAMDEGFKALAQTYCTSHFADSGVLSDLALKHFRWGGKDLALDLVARARLVARDPASVARAELVRREIALFERRFSEVAAMPDLSPRAPPSSLERWRRLKDWALFSSGDMSAAESIVGPSLKRLGADGGIDAADVRRLDLIVGGRQATGDLDGALSLARSIAAALAHAGDRADQRLVFVNAMTLALLHRARGDASAFASELERGFSTGLGARNNGDVLRLNVMRAGSDRDADAAKFHWLRAALVWLGHEPREGLGREAIVSALGNADLPHTELEAEMSTALAAALEKAWPSVANKGPIRHPDFRPAFVLPSIVPRRLFGAPGASVLWTVESMVAQPPSPPTARLIRMACAAIAEICPPFARIEGGTVSVDTNLGIDVPVTREEALSVALRARLEEFTFADKTTRLDQLERDRLFGHLEIRLSPIVREVVGSEDTVVVTFRRYLPKRKLGGPEARLVAYLARSGGVAPGVLSLALGLSAVDLEPLIRQLEKARVVRADIKPS